MMGLYIASAQIGIALAVAAVSFIMMMTAVAIVVGALIKVAESVGDFLHWVFATVTGTWY